MRGLGYTLGGPMTRSRRRAERDKMAFYNLRQRTVNQRQVTVCWI